MISKRFLRKFDFVIIGVSEQLRPTLALALEWSEAVFCSMAELVQESHAELGTKPVWTLTLKVFISNKDPRTKFWDGYRGEEHVVIDEFRGDINVSHLLRWLDRYPVRVEIKGSSVPLSARKLWFTSNIPIESWYPQLDSETMDALKRRINITHFA